MGIQRTRPKLLKSNVIAAIFALLMFGLTTSYAKIPQPSPFLSPTGGLPPRAWLPVILNNFTAPPAITISRYAGMYTLDWQTFYDLGRNRAEAALPGKDLVIVLDFGYPAYNSGSGQYGTYPLNYPSVFWSTAQITNVVQGFMSGFYNYLPPGSGTHLTVAVGVNNRDYWNTGMVSRAHGIAWAQMINYLNSWIKGPPGLDWSGTLTAWGAIDAEPSWSTATAIRGWVDGYSSAYSGKSNYLNFGTCDGCPHTGHPLWSSPWSQDDIWYVSWGASLAAFSLPEIYLVSGTNADQWQRMSLYAYTTYGQAIGFMGSLTEWNACREKQQSDPNACIYRDPNGNIVDRGDNSPEQGYSQLWYYTNLYTPTAQSLLWSSDMSWQK